MSNGEDHDAHIRIATQLEAVKEGIASIREWQKNHDVQELQQYGKIEAHMAGSEVSRVNLAAGVLACEEHGEKIEAEISIIQKKLWYTMGMVGVLTATAATLGSMFLYHLFSHGG
jgi:hypothetical protein